jgi:hypothetical protein
MLSGSAGTTIISSGEGSGAVSAVTSTVGSSTGISGIAVGKSVGEGTSVSAGISDSTVRITSGVVGRLIGASCVIKGSTVASVDCPLTRPRRLPITIRSATAQIRLINLTLLILFHDSNIIREKAQNEPPSVLYLRIQNIVLFFHPSSTNAWRKYQ